MTWGLLLHNHVAELSVLLLDEVRVEPDIALVLREAIATTGDAASSIETTGAAARAAPGLLGISTTRC